MSPHAALVDLSLTAFSNRLAERSPTPGGGSVAAHLVDVGAALTAMACRFTSGEKFASVEGAMTSRVEELERVRGVVRPLVDQDSAAYDAVTAAYKLPKSNDGEKAARTAAIQGALRGALDVPARTLAHALEALRLASAAAPDVNPNLASDAATGVWCLRSAAEAAFLNVRINAGSLADKAWAAERLAACERDLTEVRRLSDAARTATECKLG